jgi:1-phosphatidylinositol-4-phosphate 5-kinase
VFLRPQVSRVVGPDSYQMGIIDFQQEWSLSKKFERYMKIYFYGQDPYGLSAIEPEIYRDR